jgi:SAM-dependent methyltransferase
MKIQYRCPPKEFLDSRLKIVSSFLFILPTLERYNISNPITYGEEKIAGQLKENTISILDTGSRDGYVIEFLNSLGYTNVIGVELLRDYVEYCKRKGCKRLLLGDLHKLAFQDEIFDFVYCRHTLEHCLDPLEVLNELLRITKIGGAIYCSFPLEESISGKHTTAIPNIESVSNILNNVRYPFNPVYIGMAEDTSIIIPEGKEAIIFIIKKSYKEK